MKHPNTIRMQHAFFTSGERPEDSALNIVMDFIPLTANRVVSYFQKLNQPAPNILMKLYAYQLLRGLAYVHNEGVIHRDIKPQNLLVDPSCHILKICDFGSAKRYQKGDKSVAYITSRYYRAPELIFGQEHYGYAIDIWSAGCVIAELMMGQPIFKGCDATNQLLQIVKLLGTPTDAEVKAMNPLFTKKTLPQVEGIGLSKRIHDFHQESGRSG